MSNYCLDCGCRTSNGICSNCQEELYIIENQNDCIDFPLSEDFTDKAQKQQKYIEEQKANTRR